MRKQHQTLAPPRLSSRSARKLAELPASNQLLPPEPFPVLADVLCGDVPAGEGFASEVKEVLGCPGETGIHEGEVGAFEVDLYALGRSSEERSSGGVLVEGEGGGGIMK